MEPPGDSRPGADHEDDLTIFDLPAEGGGGAESTGGQEPAPAPGGSADAFEALEAEAERLEATPEPEPAQASSAADALLRPAPAPGRRRSLPPHLGLAALAAFVAVLVPTLVLSGGERPGGKRTVSEPELGAGPVSAPRLTLDPPREAPTPTRSRRPRRGQRVPEPRVAAAPPKPKRPAAAPAPAQVSSPAAAPPPTAVYVPPAPAPPAPEPPARSAAEREFDIP